MVILFKGLHLVEPSSEARRLLWHVLSVGVEARDEPERHEAYDKPGAFLFWVASGQGTLQFKGGSFHLSAGPRCWLLDLRQPRVYAPAPGRKLITNGVRFAGPGVEAWLDLLGCESEFVFKHPGDLTSIRRFQRHIIKLIQRKPEGYEWQVHTLMTQVLGVLLKERRVLFGPARPIHRAVARVLEAVAAHPARSWKARELAGVAGVSYSGLRSLFKQAQHETLKAFLQRTRLEQARLLLCDPRLMVKDVARELNFSSQYYFSRFFCQASGMSPSQYRSTIK